MFFCKSPEEKPMQSRIKAILLQELFITARSLEVIIDLFYFSLINIIVFGFFSKFLTAAINPQGAQYLLLGMILWEIVRITQYSISVGALWNIWSRNLSNMFIAPLSITEYMIAHMLSGAIKTAATIMVISLIALFVFKFNIFVLGFINLVLFFINLTIFAWSVGIVILAIIFHYGTKLQALAWGLVFVFQPLTAMFFPVTILPETMQKVAYLLPPTYVFEAARRGLSNPSVNWEAFVIALAENIVYFVLSLWFFYIMLKKSKDSGQFARNEG